MIIKESAVSAAMAMASVIVATSEAVQLGQPSASMTTPGELAYSTVGGVIGGLMLMRAIKPNDMIDGVITVIFSAVLGFSFGPAFAHWAQAKYAFVGTGDALTGVPAGAILGAIVPVLFPLFASAIVSARSNPRGLGQWVGRAVKAFWGQIRS